MSIEMNRVILSIITNILISYLLFHFNVDVGMAYVVFIVAAMVDRSFQVMQQKQQLGGLKEKLEEHVRKMQNVKEEKKDD
jgi:cell division protein FtsB